MCKEMMVIPVNRVVDQKRKNIKNGDPQKINAFSFSRGFIRNIIKNFLLKVTPKMEIHKICTSLVKIA
jgi:hypothetical protein